MAAVTQTIPYLIYGISQQPDELLKPGQVKDAKNVFLDVTAGLQKRPGGQLVGSAISDTATGKWFTIDRDTNEKYVGRIKTDGTVEIWSAADGTPRIVRYQSVPYKDPNSLRQSFIATIEANNTFSKPIAATCDTDAFTAASDAYKVALENRNSLLSQIDALEQELSSIYNSLGCKQVWSYELPSRKEAKAANVAAFFAGVSGPSGFSLFDQSPVRFANITGIVRYTYKGVTSTKEYNRPFEANTTVGTGSYIKDIDYLIVSGYRNAYLRGTQQSIPTYKLITAELYAWAVCYNEGYVSDQTSTISAELSALKAQYPAIEATYQSALAAFTVEATKCDVFVNPYQQVSGTGPYIFLTAAPTAVTEGSVIVGTYNRVNGQSIATITADSHNLSSGDIVGLTLAAPLVSGNYEVTARTSDTFEIYVGTGSAVSGAATVTTQLSGSITYTKYDGTGTGTATLNRSITYTFQRLGNLSSPTSVYYSVGGTATINNDYVISGDNTASPTDVNRRVDFLANEDSKVVTVTPNRDVTFEENETVTFTIKSDATYSVATTVPVYSGILNDDSPETTGALAYFNFEDPDDLRVLTINDYTFVTNRNPVVGPAPVAMSTSDTTTRKYEAFIELTQIAYGKQYSLDVNYYSTSQSPLTQTSADLINVVNSEFTKNDGSCPLTDTDVFDVNPSTGSSNPDANWIKTVEGHEYYYSNGSWLKRDPTSPNLDRQNLRFELLTTGQSIPKSYKDATKGYYCRYTTEATLETGGEGWKAGDTVQVTMRGKNYTITIDEIRSTQVYASAGRIRPTATSTTSSTVLKAADVLADIKTAFDSTTTGFYTEIIGNGLYVRNDKPFSISTPEAQLMNVFSDQVNNITRLPTQCKDGYIVKVINSNEEEDDYWLKFVVKQGSNTNASTSITTTGSGTTTGSVTNSGEGVWEETYQPGIKTKLNADTMPHQIVRTPDGSFVVSPIDWEPRLVGDDKSNPIPSFVGKHIQGITLFRNRLVLFSDENVVMSRPGDFFNFFAKTAITVVAADPIDIAVGSTKPASLRSAYSAKAGLVLFSDSEQFLIFTGEDVLGPDTARISSLSNYKFSRKTTPVGLGTSVAFLGDTGKNAAMYEIVEIPNNTEAKILEQSKIISSLLPDTIDQIVSTKDYSAIFLGATGSSELFVFRYFETGERRVQGAWVRWDLSGTLLHHAMLDDGYYVVIKNTDSITGKDVVTIQRFDLKKQEWSAFVQNNDAYSFNVHLDNARIVYSQEMTYDSVSDKTSFKIPFGYYSDKSLVVYTLSEGKYAGLAAVPTVTYNPDDAAGITVELDGDWSETRLLIGYTFEMDVKLPTIYQQTSTGDGTVSDTRSSLILHRLKINFGDSGIYQTTIKRLGQEDYTEEYSVPLYDQYESDTVALKERYVQTVPIYARNTDTTIHITSHHPSPATIFSVTWEGDYNNRYYRRV